MYTSSQSPDPSSALSNPSRTWTLAQSLQATQYQPFLLQGWIRRLVRYPTQILSMSPDPTPLVEPRYLLAP